jgi:predicted ferric reductase
LPPLIGQLLSAFDDIKSGNGALLVSVASPLLVASCFAMGAITSSPLPSTRTSWVNKFFAAIRTFKDNKKNQFLLSELNFNLVAICLFVLPPLVYFITSVDRRLNGTGLTTARKVSKIANISGVAGTLALSFFLIPVARHSVLLTAMGWSPVRALRLHIWAGFTSFAFIMLHCILYVVDMLKYKEDPFWKQTMPGSECWEWKPVDLPRSCSRQWANITGIVAALFFIVLLITSLNFVRRRFYRIFYICHVVFGTGMLLVAIMHWRPLALYISPSIVYYLASTMPVLVQAVASRFRGGLKIIKVVTIPDAGGCMEVRVACDTTANQALNDEPCMYVKLCVPKISLIWHPFTVYKHLDDPKTVRFLFRPIGPFTTKLAEAVKGGADLPVTLMDGFYRGANRCDEACRHDHVTIVAGGVAITPFLSMIPALLVRIAASKKEPTLKGITLLWACREEGLYRFISKEYFGKFERLAREASKLGLTMEIKVHHTGDGYTLPHDKIPSQAVPLFDDVESSGSNTGNTTSGPSISVDSRPGPEKKDLDSSSDEEDQLKYEVTETGVTGPASKGIKMEVARMMPGRFSVVWWNVPAFLAFSFMIWFGFRNIFLYSNDRDPDFNTNYVRPLGTFIALVAAVGVGVIMEGSVLYLRKSWPFAVRTYDAIRTCDATMEDSGTDQVVCVESSPAVLVLKHFAGRPSVDAILERAKQAHAPGIFACGPTAMTKAIKNEIAKEDSSFGLTRYCFYDEPFEM